MHFYLTHHNNIQSRTFPKVWSKTFQKYLPEQPIFFMNVLHEDQHYTIRDLSLPTAHQAQFDMHRQKPITEDELMAIVSSIKQLCQVSETILSLDGNFGDRGGANMTIHCKRLIDRFAPQFLTLFSGTPACVADCQAWQKLYDQPANMHMQASSCFAANMRLLPATADSLRLISSVDVAHVFKASDSHLAMGESWFSSLASSSTTISDKSGSPYLHPAQDIATHAKPFLPATDTATTAAKDPHRAPSAYGFFCELDETDLHAIEPTMLAAETSISTQSTGTRLSIIQPDYCPQTTIKIGYLATSNTDHEAVSPTPNNSSDHPGYFSFTHLFNACTQLFVSPEEQALANEPGPMTR